LSSLGALVAVDFKLKPAPPSGNAIPHLLEWAFMPLVGVFLSALPGLVAHTRLFVGRYLQYKVTEKQPKPLEALPVLALEQVPLPVTSQQ
jgi:hypothetical protein